jgi:hypothetical protein
MAKWQPTDKQCQASLDDARIATHYRHEADAIERMRLAITAAVGPAMDDALAEGRAMCKRQRARTLRVIAIARKWRVDYVTEHARGVAARSELRLVSADRIAESGTLRDMLAAATARAEQAERDASTRYDQLVKLQSEWAQAEAVLTTMRERYEDAASMLAGRADARIALEQAERDLAVMRGERDGARRLCVELHDKLAPSVGALLGFYEEPTAQHRAIESWRADAERKGNGT